MELRLNSNDVQAQHHDKPISTLRYEHLTEPAKRAVAAVGRATLWRGHGENAMYTAVYPPTLEAGGADS